MNNETELLAVVKAARPFALAPIGSGRDTPEPHPTDDTMVAYITNVTFGDFRRLRTALANLDRLNP